jgi:ammonium transporter Rh
MRKFGIGLFIVEVIYIFMFCFFVRVNPDLTRDHTDIYYPMFQDVNVMMIVGIGFIMTFIGNHSWSGLTYIFLGNCLVVQSFILMKAFWHHAIHIGWEEEPMILIEETTFSSGAYAVTAMLVGFAAIFGKVGSF